MALELDAWLEKVRKCEYLAEDELKTLCEYVRDMVHSACAHGRCLRQPSYAGAYRILLPTIPQVKEILVEESNVQPVNAPVTVSELNLFFISVLVPFSCITRSTKLVLIYCRCVVTSMVSFMTCCACLRQAGRCPAQIIFSWGISWTGATIAWRFLRFSCY